MKGWLKFADSCIAKGLFLHAYKICKYSLWQYGQTDITAEPPKLFEPLEERTAKKKGWCWWQMSDEERKVANGPVFDRSFSELDAELADLDYILQDKWRAPQ